MAIYEYRCEAHGPFEVNRPLGTAQPAEACPACGAAAVRMLSAPRVLRGSRSALLSAMDLAEKSRHEPAVVSSLPPDRGPKRARMAPITPQLMSLPRP